MNKKGIEKYIDSFMPFGDMLSSGYLGDKEMNAFLKTMFNFVVYYSDIKEPTESYKLLQPDTHKLEFLGSNLITYRMLEFIVMLKKPKNLLEIGTFAGVSAIYMASRLPEDAVLTSLEKFDKFAQVAIENINVNGFAKKVRIVNEDAMTYIANYSGDKFDLIFLDGNKENYMDYLKMLQKNMNKGCVIIVDNAFMSCDTLNDEPVSEKAIGVKKMLDYSKELNCFKILLPISDGVLILALDE